MKILHVTPHLGGSVGKAHAAISAALPQTIARTYVLLEPPRDQRYIEMIAATGADILVAPSSHSVVALAGVADIVQFEFWNHPRTFEGLARCSHLPMRSVFWSHISGLAPPLVPASLIEAAGRFVFTTEASRVIANGKNIAVINSGFGFAGAAAHRQNEKPVIAYLGTVDTVKMHPGFFAAIDALQGDGIEVRVWGAFELDGEVAALARAMRYPERVSFCGETSDPASALAQADIFFYPLQPRHFGTAESALVEAMSLGLVPVVIGNPAERAIVRHAETGLVAHSIEHCVSLLQSLIDSLGLRRRLSESAARDVSHNRTPARAADGLVALWAELLGEAARVGNFRKAFDDNPADWFLATQGVPAAIHIPAANVNAAAKGTLTHFESVFSGDSSLAGLRATS